MIPLKMGNIFSRSMPLRESLVKLEEQIAREEKSIKRLRIMLKSLRTRIWMISAAAVILSVGYSYIDGQNIIVFLIGSIAICYVTRYFLVYLYELRIGNLESTLEILKERQKEQIDLLKKDESFEVTKKLIDKYESETTRRDYFSKVRQREKGMVDSVTDLVLGDDPGTMYALVCKKCHYHNGLVHPGEYDLTEFYCYNCHELNVRTSIKKN